MKRLHKVKMIALIIVLTLGVNLLPVGANVITAGNMEKISSALLTAMSEAGSGEKLPVYIWTQDVDHTQVERQVQAKTGLSAESLVSRQKKADFDIAKISAPELAQQKMEAYLEETEEVREQERELADAYIEQRRQTYVAEYSAKNAQSLRRLNVDEEDILFQSQYSPMVIVNMSPSEITSASNNTAVISMGLCEDSIFRDDSINSMIQHIMADVTISKYGLTGSGVKIGQIELNVPDPSYTNFEGKVTVISGEYSNHANNVAMILHSVAPNAQIYSIGLGNNNNMQIFCDKVEQLLNRGVKVINMSASGNRPTNTADYWYSPTEQWLDHISGTHEVTFVKSAGNNDPNLNITNPGLAHNIITVGAFDDHHTGSDWSDDSFYQFSNSGNGGDDGCAKPDLLAPGTIDGVDAQGNYAQDIGTSYAAPLVAGLVAQMMGFRPVLQGKARSVKAILLASCDHKVTDWNSTVQETMEQGLTAKQGAGVVNAMRMYDIVDGGRYLSGNFTGSSYMTEIGLSGTTNVAATWLRENGVSNHTSGTVTVSPYQNCDLYLYSPTGVQYDSRLNMSSTELIYRNTLSSGVYNVQLHKRDGNTNRTIWFGIAWY